ncbi:MAG: ribose 5-phosphate isomerase B [Gemmatimonadetes bacterium]|nr:ribose 5-phosphate isomerase B [Gemmatimonadota bacterium]MBK6778724.1 ribose 5-phosphate isomerase B [Gemmatimonadota bacterium]MBK7348966.1 ribose 5-phosphate isomerase B [Gemmatimonadota bacterium]MBK7714526.1 ribose 5-phosphate isomerase B [Gemmatimonadota bacterium]MBK7783595.1 ribose 5-phosphate isomerase B [Gemmatimonadota bacterium]
MPEVIPIGADHAGFALKERLKQELAALGYAPLDLGTHSADSTDYPDYAHPVAARVERGEVARGILLCGTGLGMAYAANRHQGVRAAVAWTPDVARLARAHNDANILVLPARFVSEQDGLDILRAWLDTPFEGGRHQRRVEKIEP